MSVKEREKRYSEIATDRHREREIEREREREKERERDNCLLVKADKFEN